MRNILIAALLVSGLALTGCDKQLEAPTDVGVCWHMVTGDDGKPKFNKLAAGVPKIELCAARLEAMRLDFARLGQRNDEVIGAYQGQFVWLEREGVFFSQTINGARYPALVRTGDGRLAIPGAMPADPAPAASAAPPAK
ncbi:MAG: hypothetical protein U1E50_11550 [Caulobacteraceae bacterium]